MWRASLPAADPADYFGLTKPEQRTVQLIPGDLAVDFDLQVLRPDGGSALTGLRSETLRLNAAPGRYLVRVHPKPGQSSPSPYRLVATLLGR